eukprot:Filipodium_phascolosomae@DN6754_c0_g1_i1.p1
MTEPIPDYARFYCRVASMASKEQLPKTSNVMFGKSGKSIQLKGLELIDLGGGVRCLIFLQGPAFDTVIFSFSYFEDTKPWVWVTTGLSMMLTSGLIDNISSFFFQKANQFFWHFKFQEVLHTHNEISKFVFCGFSLGGGIAHAVAYLFDTEDWRHPSNEINRSENSSDETDALNEPVVSQCTSREPAIHVYGFGNVRVGNEEYSDWYASRVDEDSFSALLTKHANSTTGNDGENDDTGQLYVDPIGLIPPLSLGFSMIPNTYLIMPGGVYWQPVEGVEHLDELTRGQKETNLSLPTVMYNLVTSQSIFDKLNKDVYNSLHSLLVYFEQLMT